MKGGVVISVVIALAATVGLTAVFMNNASPYAKIAEASKYSGSNGIHVVGEMVPDTLVQDPLRGQMKFQIKDGTGMMNVVYTGSPVSNIQSAKQVVVIGGYDNGTFHARDMLLKCPSKYESERGAAKPD